MTLCMRLISVGSSYSIAVGATQGVSQCVLLDIKGFTCLLEACAYRNIGMMILPRGILHAVQFVLGVCGTDTKTYIVVVVVVFTPTRIIKSVVTGQSPVTQELGNTPGKNTNKPMVVHAYITADEIHASTSNIKK